MDRCEICGKEFVQTKDYKMALCPECDTRYFKMPSFSEERNEDGSYDVIGYYWEEY